MRPTRFFAAGASGLLFGGAFLGSAAPAHADTVASVTEASLLAKGAAVALEISYTCEPGFELYAAGTLTQRVGKATVSGSAAAGPSRIACTGESQLLTLNVTPGSGAFKRGEAFFSLYYNSCHPDIFICTEGQTQSVVRVG